MPDEPAPAAQSTPAAASDFVPDDIALATLLSMGIEDKKAKKALKQTSNNVERAIDWVFSHPEDDGSDDPPATATATTATQPNQESQAEKRLTDGGAKYELTGFISHIGPTVHVGHYVCHLLKDGQWYIFNDSKVAKSENPPKSLGYLYLYKRK